MSANSKIEWTDHTFNPWIGCTKVSPACDHCYAEVSTPSRTLGVTWGAGRPRRLTHLNNWSLVSRWNATPFFECPDCGLRGSARVMGDEPKECKHANAAPTRARVFCASLADVFDNEVDPQWRVDLFALIQATPNLDWLLLTKRIGNAHQMIGEALIHLSLQKGKGPTDLMATWPWPNVWIGATICNQEEADRDIPKLLKVPAAKRFLSMEPLLGPVDLAHLNKDMERHEISALKAWTWEEEVETWRDTDPEWAEQFEDWHGHKPGQRTGPAHATVDWVIVGGESGHLARPMHPDWARSLRDQCAAAGVPFLFKQWGEWAPVGTSPVHPESTRIPGNLCRVTLDGVTADHYVAISTDGGRERYEIRRVGKKAAGRLLDGIQHDGYPK